MWLISRARRNADLSSLPTVVQSSIMDKDSQVRYYYIPFTDDEVHTSQASQRESWTLCWDSNVAVDRSYYAYQHSQGMKFSFVRVDDVEPPPIDSIEDASWEDMRHVHVSLLQKALDLYIWNANIRKVKGTMRRRSNRIEASLQAIIGQAIGSSAQVIANVSQRLAPFNNENRIEALLRFC